MKLNVSFCQNLKLVFLGLALAGAVSCAKQTQPSSANLEEIRNNFVQDGLIVMSRRAPIAATAKNQTMLGFVPGRSSHEGYWLSINRQEKTVNLMQDDKVLKTTNGEGLASLQAGVFKLLHKQRAPLWYAPDSYFQDRALPVPAQGDKARFRRGALGDYAMFLDKSTPIHNGPIWSEEVGGVRVGETDLSKIYYTLDVGSVIEVK